MSEAGQEMPSRLFGDLAYCTNMQVAAGTDITLFGGPPREIEVAAQFFF